MGWQEREKHINEALLVLGKRQREIRRSRIHEETREARSAKIRALRDGDCGRCQVLIIKIKEKGRGKEVALMCRFGKSPSRIHVAHLYDLGEVPTCNLLVPFEQEE